MAPMGTLWTYLPQGEGLLPKWLFFISVVSIFNSAQTYFSGLDLTRRVYSNDRGQVTQLSARTFGTWTLLASIVRLYGAYYIESKPVYDLCFASFALAGFHFGSEWLAYGTTKLGKGLAGPLVVSSLSIVWMVLQREYYVLA